MPTISRRAISNNANLTGAAISLREGIAYFCSSYEPWTATPQAKIGELVGMKASQASKAMAELKSHGEVAEDHGRIYLLKLDDWQLQEIAQKDFGLLKTLAELGCEDAKPIVSKMEMIVSISETSVTFLLHHFMFAEFPYWKQTFPNQKGDVSNTETNVSNMETPFKGNITMKILNNDDVLGEEEEGDVSSRASSEPTQNPSSSSGGAAADIDDLPTGDKDEPRADELNSGKNHEKNKENWVQSHIRSDIKKLENWLDHLQILPECENISVRELWKKYERNCKKKKNHVFRDWFLERWLWKDLQGVPEKLSEEEELPEENALDTRFNGSKTSKQKRDEYAISANQLREQNRKNVERRRAELLRSNHADDR